MALNATDQNELRVQAGRVAGNANLRDIRLMRSQVCLNYVPEPVAKFDVELEISPEAVTTPRQPDGKGLLLVNCGFEVKISDGGTRETPVAIIDCEFTAAFDHSLPDDTADGELEAFANTTGAFAIYPYAREYISDATRRLGLPTLVLDLFKP